MYDIKKAAVLGSGVMGGAIAAHLANAGLLVAVLDIVPDKLTLEEQEKGLKLTDAAVRNRIVGKARERMANPRSLLLYTPSIINRVTFGNFEDDLELLHDADWVVEAVVENLDIKRALFGKIASYLKPSAILSTNTSGISVNDLADALPPNLRERFLVTHFFNPPRFMKLVELVPCTATTAETISYMRQFCDEKLGKGVVVAKDTPGFIANRIGVYSLALIANKMYRYGLSVEEVDAITGSEIGRPKTGTFRLIDMIGIDTMLSVANYQLNHVTQDGEKAMLKLPGVFAALKERGWLGDKTKQGFYKKAEKDVHVLDTTTFEYRPKQPVKFASLDAVKSVKELKDKLAVWLAAEDNAGRFVWDILKGTLLFAGGLIPEIADDVEAVDNAMKWGYNWEVGPFELWDMIGVRTSAERMLAEGETLPPFVAAMLASGKEKFYDSTAGYHDSRKVSAASLLRRQSPIRANADASLLDIGDEVACFVIHSPNNSVTDKLMEMLDEALAVIAANYRGMVIAGSGKHFCVGANLPMILRLAEEKNWEALAALSAKFQRMNMAIKYSPKPVVAAPYGMTLGGGAEIVLHCAGIQAQAETAIGLVETGVGLLPGAGGNKELLLHLTEAVNDNVAVDLAPFVKKAFDVIASAKVSASGPDAREIGFLRSGDGVVMNPELQLYRCKKMVLDLADTMAMKNPAVKYRVAGESMYAGLKAELYNKRRSGFITEHDELIGSKIAYVLCGGRVPADSFVSEQYLLDLERECFVSLCGEAKTQERIAYMLKNRKPLRN